jgi:hypothetical protein
MTWPALAWPAFMQAAHASRSYGANSVSGIMRHSSGSRIIPATDGRCRYSLGDRAIWGVLMAA